MKDMIDAELQAKNLTAPRVTMQDIENEIASEHYFTAAEGVVGRDFRECVTSVDALPQSLELLTFCVLVLKNGFTEVGKSACASPENYDAGIGRKIARENAIEKLWPLLGFRLRDQLSQPIPPTVEVEVVGVSGYASRPVELGDQVRFHERVNTLEAPAMAAFVTNILSDNRVALTVLAPNGTVHARDNVLLINRDDVPPSDVSYYARPL